MSSYGSIQSLIQRFEDPNEIVNIEDEVNGTKVILTNRILINNISSI